MNAHDRASEQFLSEPMLKPAEWLQEEPFDDSLSLSEAVAWAVVATVAVFIVGAVIYGGVIL